MTERESFIKFCDSVIRVEYIKGKSVTGCMDFVLLILFLYFDVKISLQERFRVTMLCEIST